MYGYNGKVLLVNLTDKTYEIEDLPEEWAKMYLGGSTLGARYLYRLMKPNTPALAPEAVLGIVCGVTNGSNAFMGTRVAVVCKSPVNDLWNDSSCGGSFGPHLRASGFDAVFITGKSEKPCTLFLNDGEVEFRDASHLWGKVTSWVDDTLHEELGKDVSVFQIGPGGEHQSWMAAIICDKHRAAGRGGCGGVMGSKNLKAVVARGSHKIEIFDNKEI
ncbi:MAG: aldehyde ferredoxin oxidoreductase, partial [Oscillospiraceae bacterium]|nr:aldehyde ferredoxin oxidoreductase [Oscillospiraceae bacterium]